MRQLALDLKLADFALFETFYAGPNAAVVGTLKQAATEPGPRVTWLWGGTGTGRSHLLQALVAAASKAGDICAWLPLADSDLAPGMLEGMGALQVLCVDDIDRVAGDAAWERALFRMFEDLRNNKGRLLVSASAPASEVAFALPDLQSRLASGPTWKLQPLDDDALLAAMQLRARWRGLELPEETGRYLLRRVERTTATLFALLDELDAAALEAQRGLTIPFVSNVLEQRAS
jgi:DnaA family protein